MASETQEQRAEVNGVVLDKIIETLHLKNDAALSRAMRVSPPVISKLRSGSLKFGDTYIVMAHELTGWTIREIKGWLGKTSLPSYRQVAN